MAASRKEQKDLIKQIDSVIANVQSLLLKQFEQANGGTSAYVACKHFILTTISKWPETIYNEAVEEFRKSCEANEALDVEFRKEKGEILKNCLQKLERNFDPQIGYQPAYIKEALKSFLSTGTNNIQVNKKTIEEDVNLNSIFTHYLTLYGYLLRQKFCLEQMKEVGAQEGYAKTASFIKKALESDLKEINPQRIALLKEESEQFNRVWKEAIRRLKMNDNDICKPFDVPNGDSSLAIFIKKVNAQFYNNKGESNILSSSYINDIHQKSLAAKKTGDEIALQKLQRQTKAVFIWMTEVEKNLKIAFQEYEHASHQKIQEMDQNVLRDIKRSLEVNDEIFKMRYVLAIIDVMYCTNSLEKYKTGYDLLRSATLDLKHACAGLDVTVGYSNGWIKSAQDIEKELVTLVDKLIAYTEPYRDKDKCQAVEGVFNSFGQLKKTFDDQRKIPKEFEKTLKETHDQIIGAEATVPSYFSAHWYAKCQEIIKMKAVGVPSFINRHWKKMAIGSGVLGSAAAALGMTLFITSVIVWPLVIPMLLAGLVMGGLIGALTGGFLDKCCRMKSPLNELSVMEAGWLLGLGEETRQQFLPRSSSAVALNEIGVSKSNNMDEELDDLSKILNKASDSFDKDKVAAKEVRASSLPSSASDSTAIPVGKHNPFA